MEVWEQRGKTTTARTLTETELRKFAVTDRQAAREVLRLDWPTLTTEQKLERLKDIL